MGNADASEIIVELSKAGISTISEILKTILINSREYKQFKNQMKLQEFKAKLENGIITKKDLLGIKNGVNNIDTLRKTGEKLYSIDVSANDLKEFVNKCNENNIPISVVADTNNIDKVQIVCLEGDKEQMDSIALSIINEKDKSIYSMFEIDETAIDSMSILAEKNNLEVNFFKNDDGKTYCQYLNNEQDMIDEIHQQVLDAKKKVESINTYIKYDENLEDRFEFIVEDTNMQIARKSDFCNKDEFIEKLQVSFDYDELIANEIANKLYNDLENKVNNLNRTNMAKIEHLNEELIPLSEELDFEIPEYQDIDDTIAELNNRIAEIDYNINRDDISENDKVNLANDRANLSSAIDNLYNQKSIVDDGIKFNTEKLDEYIVDFRQKQLFKRFETNISVVGENPAIKDFQFSRAVYKKDDAEHILIQDKNTKKAVSYRVPIDRKMLENDLKDTLGISDKLVLSSLMHKCEQLGYVDKAKIINVDKKYTIQADLSNSVTVTLGDKSVKCDLNDIYHAKKNLQREFGMSEKKADKIINKAKKQNPNIDNIRKAMQHSKLSPLTNKIKKRGSI